jgi:hypothetical protein
MTVKQNKKPGEIFGPKWDVKILGKIGNTCSIQYIRQIVNGNRRDNTELAQQIKIAALELKKERKQIKKINLL